MTELAQFLGRHALLTLIVASVLMMLVTAALWWLVERIWQPLWQGVARVWEILATSSLGRAARRIPLLSGSFSHTLTVWRFVGIHAILSFIVALFALAAFVELGDEIDEGEDFARFDSILTQSLGASVDLATLELFAVITHLGDREVTIGVGAIVGLYLLARRWWLHAVVWGLTTGLGGILVRLLKQHFERTRPIHEHALTDSTGWSFPSGHASGAMLVYGMLGYLLIRHTPRTWHIPIALATITLITFVGFSRVILQVHYLSDVLAGFAVASAWMGLWVSAFEAIRHQSRESRLHRQESLAAGKPSGREA